MSDWMKENIVIEKMSKADWNQVREIYLEGINTGNATFDTESPTWEEWNEKYAPTCRLVVKEEGNVIGWAALLPMNGKAAFYGVAELSIYLSPKSAGKGIGTRLLSELITASEANGFWTLQSGIFPENVTSIKLHRNAGFREVGVRRRLGRLNGVWRDVVMLERRSSVVGVD
ncbi:GNAT family N-acetyltransferase [Virgibacillus ainsalahensis]